MELSELISQFKKACNQATPFPNAEARAYCKLKLKNKMKSRVEETFDCFKYVQTQAVDF